MSRKKKQNQQKDAAPAKPRSSLHEILRGRKASRHTPDHQKRAKQKLRRALEEE